MTKIFDHASNREPSRTLFPALTIPPRIELVLLIMVICIAAFFRLYHLGVPAFRADTMIFMDLARQPVDFADVFAKWTSTLGMNNTGQFPFAVAWLKLLLSVTGAPLTPFMIRLPSAIWGILAVLAIYGAGRVLAGNAFALFLAALFALDPFHIGISREAYFYPPLVLGSTLLLWSIFLQIRAVEKNNLLPITGQLRGDKITSSVGPALAHGRLIGNSRTANGTLQAAALQNPPLAEGLPLPGAFYILLAAGFFLTTYAQPSAWSFAFMAVLIILWFQIKDGLRTRRIPRSLLWIVLILAVIGIPLLFADWALPHMIRISSPEQKAYNIRVFGTQGQQVFFLLFQTLFSFGWGRTLPRVLFTIVVFLLSAAATARLWRRSAVMPITFIFLAGGIGLYLVARYLLMIAVSSRYLLALLPLYLTWLALGLWFAADILCAFKHSIINNAHRLSCHSEQSEESHPRLLVWLRSIRCAQDDRTHRTLTSAAVSIGIMVVALSLNIWPAWLATQLTGKPIPYWDIVHWCDKSLPPRTLVLVERWFDPWNELRVHNSTNIFFTFTVPSEPADTFKQVNWPLTARQFMEKFPDAAYLEYSRAERQVKGVVTNWSFARSVSFTNAALIRLAHLGLAHREEFYAPNNDRLTATIFYNTREDVIAQARHRGNQYLVLYGPEWGYVKLWQQLRDFRDWRILEQQASLDVYNLTASTNRVVLKIRGMALNGSKRVASGGEYPSSQRDFRHLQLEEWALKDITLRPGLNKIVFSDSLWSVSKIPLLVDQVEVIPAPL